MTKVLKVENLDCANCAAKMERGIKNLDGVKDCTLSFMTGRLTIDADETKFGEIIKAAAKLVKKIESGANLILK
ncbi:MAG: heavy-metal-associated domain-containing protein [Clostridiales bacterium]|jgi:copper chaperone CopZ|nr:heavy-metal-associated domain-containing protein [Clostridiales bacterium]